MEIQALRAVITEQDVNDWLAQALAGNRQLDVRDLRVRLTQEGACVSGVYESRIIDVPFESVWELSAPAGKAGARLASFRPLGGLGGKAFGVADALSSGSLRQLLMRGIADALTDESSVKVEGDTIFCDVDGLLAANGISVRTNLSRLHCEPGQLVIEAAAPAA